MFNASPGENHFFTLTIFLGCPTTFGHSCMTQTLVDYFLRDLKDEDCTKMLEAELLDIVSKIRKV